MGMIKSFIFDWLEDHGFELGYDWDKLPSIDMMEGQCPTAQEYYGDNK